MCGFLLIYGYQTSVPNLTPIETIQVQTANVKRQKLTLKFPCVYLGNFLDFYPGLLLGLGWVPLLCDQP